MLEDMKPIRVLQVGDLVRHKQDPEAHPETSWAGHIGIVLELPKITHVSDSCSYPTILWDDGEIGTAHRQYLEIVE